MDTAQLAIAVNNAGRENPDVDIVHLVTVIATGGSTPLIVATAGHVDHGKTSLVKQLTGVDTDRLEEEKRRGLSINLGYAYRKLSDSSPIGFIDVPGHNRFINTMIAGVGGIDIGMLVVAADDGPMPQTIEHLNILRLLGVQQLLLVLTKIDRVFAARVHEVETRMRGLLADQGGQVPAFTLSNASGEGVPALLSHLEQVARDATVKSSAGCFRLSIDRAFTLKGVGLVLTGTVTAGSVRVGDFLQLQPTDVKLRVRSLYVQDEQADTASAGQRCALNVVGDIERGAIVRGNWLLGIDAGPPSLCIATRVRLLDAAPFALKHLSPVKIYLGARRVAGRLCLLEGDARLNPGGDALAHVLLRESLCCCHGERFLLRDDSESVTLGGGVILNPYATRTRVDRPRERKSLRALETDSAQVALEALAVEQEQLLDVEQFRHSWNLRESELPALFAPNLHRFDVDGRRLVVAKARWQQGLAAIPRYLEHWHQRHPAVAGISINELQAALDVTLEAPLLAALLDELRRVGVLALKSGSVRLNNFNASLSDEDVARLCQFEACVGQRGTKIPLLSQIAAETGLGKKTLQRLGQLAVRDGRLHKLNDNRYATAQQLAQLAQLAMDLAAENQPVTVVNFKDRMGTGRKVAIEVLEYFDSIEFTRRRGDTREILDAELPARLFES